MAVGKMRERLALQSQTRTADGGGSEAVTWSTFATVYGHIDPKSGNERLFGDQLEERVTHIITIRFRRDMSHKNRIVYEYFVSGTKYTRTFNIKRVINRGTRNQYLDILVEEGVAT
jgi:SPP1 family predicted phage head-tail adaptor